MIADTFGAKELFYDPETGELEGARGSYVQHGRAYFEDERSGLRYRITDPVLAFVAGVDGWVEVGGELLCFDVDGDCDGERASYIELDAFTTAPSHSTVCGGTTYSPDVCGAFHTFFNKTWFPVPWSRHGSNVEFVYWDPFDDTRLRTTGFIEWNDQYGAPLSAGMPTETVLGENWVESAVWCAGVTSCPEYQAHTACGRGHVDDPDLRAGQRTGNGPGGTNCPSGAWHGI